MSGKDTIEPTPEDWLAGADEEFVVDQEISHPDPSFEELRDKASQRLRIEHDVVATLGELRRAAGFNQSEIAERWGRGQSQVSKVERAPDSVEIATLAGYVRALGGNLSITIEVGGHTYHEDLVAS
ncbi:MAG TPA: helix-turn-helix domain-containing protein [Acidimicrobiales bacterium]|nr:helix-turn-helix domain-containing protein [Acidimicrobiales bacterium]